MLQPCKNPYYRCEAHIKHAFYKVSEQDDACEGVSLHRAMVNLRRNRPVYSTLSLAESEVLNSYGYLSASRWKFETKCLSLKHTCSQVAPHQPVAIVESHQGGVLRLALFPQVPDDPRAGEREP